MNDARPSSGRLVLACFTAAVLAPAPMAFDPFGGSVALENAIELLPLVMLFGVPVALLHIGFIAVPIYIALRPRYRLRWWNAALAGFLIGALPMSLLSQAFDGMAITGLCGLVGGLAFWAVLRPGLDPDDRGKLRRTFG